MKLAGGEAAACQSSKLLGNNCSDLICESRSHIGERREGVCACLLHNFLIGIAGFNYSATCILELLDGLVLSFHALLRIDLTVLEKRVLE